jgi:tubulin--tyrosine ligase-like protein 12
MHYDKSRAIYGVDLMIDDNMKPNILEMTYAPDCHRAVEYYPDFFNDIFEVLFLG